ncbi:MAG: DUF5652 family protein [Bacteroides sp.]|jgi:hypothetical protein|nr:DUF5652 family protein [Bacteroides sp.]
METSFNELIRAIPAWVYGVILFDGILKLIAMYAAAGRKQTVWYICLAIFNTVGLLPIVYLLIHGKKTEVIQ